MTYDVIRQGDPVCYMRRRITGQLDPMNVHLRPGQSISRANGTDLRRGWGDFEIRTYLEPKKMIRHGRAK